MNLETLIEYLRFLKDNSPIHKYKMAKLTKKEDQPLLNRWYIIHRHLKELNKFGLIKKETIIINSRLRRNISLTKKGEDLLNILNS